MEVQKLYRYLAKHQVFGVDLPLGDRPPQLMVVVPCYDEPDLFSVLSSLEAAMVSHLVVELIVVVNDGEHSDEGVLVQNDQTYDHLNVWRHERRFSFHLLPLRLKGVRRKHAGVGYARKVGMDLAVWRSAHYGNADIPIISLDADTLVSLNYFTELWACFSQREVSAAIVRFEHLLSGDAYEPPVYEAVARYELHLRYLNQGLKYSGYPYVCHTVGSAFAVRASAYAKHGGMNRRQGGEDFYFIHKLLPHECFAELNTCCVYPSSRPSLRVPFGTGPQVSQSVSDGCLVTYHPGVFEVLKEFIAQVPLLYVQDVVLSQLVTSFLKELDFDQRIIEIRKNAATQDAFVKRFFAFFDAFQLVKFLNYAHQSAFAKIDVEQAATRLLQVKGIHASGDLLQLYRKVEAR